MIVHRCCLSIVPAVSGKSQLLYWSHRKLPQRIFPGTVIKKLFHFFHSICLKNKKSGTASAVCNLCLLHISFQHHFFHLIRMLFLKLLKMFQIVTVHKKPNSRNLFLFFCKNRRFPGSGIHCHCHKILPCGKRNKIGADAVSAHSGTNLNDPDISRFVDPKLAVPCAVSDFKCVKGAKHRILNFSIHFFRYESRLQMTCLNIMGTACCKFFCYCKAGVFTLIADGFHTVLCTLNIFFHNRSVFKRLFCRLCDGLFQLFLGINLCYGPASGTVCGLYNNRKALRKHSVSHRDCLKKRHRDSGLLKGSPHGKLVGGIFNTCAAVSRKSKLLCQILHCNICQIRTYG